MNKAVVFKDDKVLIFGRLWWQVVGMGILSIVIAVCVWKFLYEPVIPAIQWLNIIMLVLVISACALGLFGAITNIIRMKLNKPIAIVYSDRFERFNIFKMKNDVIYFKDIMNFYVFGADVKALKTNHKVTQILPVLYLPDTSAMVQLLNDYLCRYRSEHGLPIYGYPVPV